ncbi:hypothetical protein BH11ARM2_BH11ARM2_10580 [soil metagenome]
MQSLIHGSKRSLLVLPLLLASGLSFGQELRLKTGDVVRVVVTVQSSADTYSGDYLVQSDGSIYGVGFGSIHVADRTVAEAQSLLREAMKRLVRPEEVLLTLKSEVARRVFVLGAPGGSAASGTVDIVGKLGLRQALAGIVTSKDADLLDVRVFRAGKQIAQVNLAKLLDGTADEGNLDLQPDDVVSIAPIPTVRVWITGSVRDPGPKVVPQDASIDQAISQAGGVALPTTSDSLAIRGEYRVILRRGTTNTEFPIWGGSSALAAAVEAGDTISVEPPIRNRIVVTGEVKNPGEIIAKPGTSLLSALAQAGGVTLEGSPSNVIVYRNGEPIVVNADVNLDQQTGSQFVLQDNDTVIVRKNERVAYVFGEVLRQGRVTVPVGKTFRVTDALALSGGLSPNGTFRRVHLARPGPDGRFVVTLFNLDEFIKDGKVASNPELKPGDVLLFGQPRQTFLTSATQVIGSLLFVNSISGAAGLRTILP